MLEHFPSTLRVLLDRFDDAKQLIDRCCSLADDDLDAIKMWCVLVDRLALQISRAASTILFDDDLVAVHRRPLFARRDIFARLRAARRFCRQFFAFMQLLL